jgi:hypothetical protein
MCFRILAFDVIVIFEQVKRRIVTVIKLGQLKPANLASSVRSIRRHISLQTDNSYLMPSSGLRPMKIILLACFAIQLTLASVSGWTKTRLAIPWYQDPGSPQ